MLRRILVALDGSPLAESALPLAASLARASGATLILIQAAATGESLEYVDSRDPSIIRYIPPAPNASEDPAITQQILCEGRRYLQALADIVHTSGVTVETAVVPGEAADVLVDEATRRQADLIVMTTRGRSGLGRWLYGSVAEAVLSHSTVPVLLVRAGTPPPSLSKSGGKIRLLVPLDGSSTAEQALAPATSLAQALDADVVLVRIVPSSPASITQEPLRFGNVSPTRPSDAYEREAETYLEGVAKRLQSDGLRVLTVVADDHPPAGIAAAAEQVKAAIIVMATHGRTGLGRFVLGSVAYDVLRQGTRPTLLIRPTAVFAARPGKVTATK